MNKLTLLTATAMALFGLTATLQAANTNALAVTLQITALIQNSSAVTNSGVVTTTYTTKSATIANANILGLLQTEFSISFPTGAKLGYNVTGQSGFVVLDQNDNFIMSATTNPADAGFSFVLSNNVLHAGAPLAAVGKSVDNTATTNQTIVVTANQPDYGIFYQDSHGNKFHFSGLLVEKLNQTTTASNLIYNSVSFTLTGTGGGDFFNPADGKIDTAAFTKAKFVGTGKGLVQ